MLSTAAKQSARLEINALCSLGFTRSDAIGMTAQRLRKSLPPIDDPLPTAPNRETGKWSSSKSDSANDREKVALSQDEKDSLTKIRRKKFAVSPKSGKPYNPRKWIIDYPNGKRFQYTLDQNVNMKTSELGEYTTREMTISDWHKMHEHVANHSAEQEKDAEKGEQTKQPDKADNKESTTMKKSNRLEKLIARAKADPSKLQTQTIQALNQHLVNQGREPIIKPIPRRSWFRPQTLSEIGADRDARAAYMPPVSPVKMPSLKDAKMSTAEIQEYRLQQARNQEAAQKG